MLPHATWAPTLVGDTPDGPETSAPEYIKVSIEPDPNGRWAPSRSNRRCR